MPPLSADQHKRAIRWIQTLLWDPTAFAPAAGGDEPEVLRLKGILWSAADPAKGWVLQGVRGVYELEDVERGLEETGDGKLVVIGRFVGALETSLREALASTAPM